MYGYSDHIDLTPEQVLQKVSKEEIFNWILRESLDQAFDLKNRYLSPFREEDRHPDCRFEVRNDGAILFVDFGEEAGKTHRSCFKMVMDWYNLSLQGAIEAICAKFGLSSNSFDYKPVVTQPYIRTDNPSDAIITYDPIYYDSKALIFWSQFTIRKEHLFEDGVFYTNRFYIQYPDKPKKAISVYGLCFALDFIDRVKLYQPYSKDYKWITNCDEDYIGNIDNLPPEGEELVITKSYKDHRVIRNLLNNRPTIWLQNEGQFPSDWVLEMLLKRFKITTVFFDNDKTGIKASKDLVEKLNGIRPNSTRSITLPRKKRHLQLFNNYLKDPGEWVHKEGREDTQIILKKIGL